VREWREPSRGDRPPPDWLITEPEPYDEYDLGPLKTGKEAEIFLIERTGGGGRSCILAHKRYRPKRVTTKGQLEALGFQGVNAFVNDSAYRNGRKFPNSRDERAARTGTTYGKQLLSSSWPGHELEVMTRLWQAGVNVPFPVGPTTDGLLMEYVGDRTGAAPRLAQARLDRAAATRAAEQLTEDLHRMVSAGLVHADLSPYNLLWWQGRLWLIDLPQAVDIAHNLNALDLLNRDLQNVGSWFRRQGVAFDPDEVFADLLSSAFG
jgi:RIO kinase 1